MPKKTPAGWPGFRLIQCFKSANREFRSTDLAVILCKPHQIDPVSKRKILHTDHMIALALHNVRKNTQWLTCNTQNLYTHRGCISRTERKCQTDSQWCMLCPLVPSNPLQNSFFNIVTVLRLRCLQLENFDQKLRSCRSNLTTLLLTCSCRV